MKKNYFLLAISIIINTGLFAQSQFTLYQFNSQLPQANMVNAGLFPDYKVTIGIPTLSSVYISNDFGQLSYNRIFSRTANDSLYFDADKLINQLDEDNHIALNGAEQLIYLGLRFKKNFFSLSLNERIEGGISYPKSLVKLISTGDGINLGQVFAFDELSMRGQVFHELAIGYGRQINDKLSVGVRAKFLSGIVSIDTDNISAALIVSPDSLYLYSPAFNINTAGLDLFFEDASIFEAATAFNNRGFALDIGAHYWLTDKLRIAFAMNDMGAINWQNDTRQFQFEQVIYSYSGMDLVAAINNESGALFEQETDSLINLYTPDTVAGIGYKTQLSPKFYGSASYHLGKHHTFGAMMYADVFKGTLKPAFGLSYNLRLGHIWTIGVNGSYRNKSFKNLGLGTTLTLGVFQIYAITENITALSSLSDARFIDLRFGMNLVFGKLKKDKKSFAKKEKEEVPAIILTDPLNTNAVLTETVVSGVAGNAKDELPSGFYIVIATFSSQDEATSYSKQLQFEGYAASFGYQSELDKYYIYLMYFSADGNKAIEKKNALKESLAPGLEIPWVLWVKDQE